MARRLDDTEVRFKAFMSQSEEGLWVWEVKPAGDLSLSPDQLVEHLLNHMILVEANERAIAVLGGSDAGPMIGRSISDLYNMEAPEARRVIEEFVATGAHFHESKNSLYDKLTGKDRHFINRMQGIVEDHKIVTIWGSLRDVSDQQEAETKSPKC